MTEDELEIILSHLMDSEDIWINFIKKQSKDQQENIYQKWDAVMNVLQNHFAMSNKEEKVDFHAKIK